MVVAYMWDNNSFLKSATSTGAAADISARARGALRSQLLRRVGSRSGVALERAGVRLCATLTELVDHEEHRREEDEREPDGVHHVLAHEVEQQPRPATSSAPSTSWR